MARLIDLIMGLLEILCFGAIAIVTAALSLTAIFLVGSLIYNDPSMGNIIAAALPVIAIKLI